MSNDLMKLGEIQGTMERPKSLQDGDLWGTENIGADDLRLPRLSIAQGMSPQMIPDEGQYIDGLKLGDLFNDLTNEIYGRGPITFVPVRRDVRRIEFVPRAEGGGIVDLNVPADDPRNSWTTNEKNERVPPVATKFVEFVIVMLRPGKAPEPIVLSIKDTNKHNRRAAEQLTAFIKLRNAPIYAGMYTVATSMQKKDNATYGVPVVKNAGFIPRDTPGGEALYDYVKQFAESLEGKEIIINREPGDETDDEATDFDTSRM